MDSDNVTVRLLEQIRDATEKTAAGLDQTNERLDHMNGRLASVEQRVDVLADRVVESEIRTATAITQLTGTLESVKTLLTDRLDLSDRMVRCEKDILRLKQKTGIK